MPIYDDFTDWILFPIALFAVLSLFLMYLFIGGLTIIHWKTLGGELKVFIPALGIVSLIGLIPRVFGVFPTVSVLLWCGVLFWIYFFHTCEEGVVSTQRWLARVLRLFSPTYQLGLRLEKTALVGYHPWGVLKTFQYGLGLYVVTTVLDISFRIWG